MSDKTYKKTAVHAYLKQTFVSIDKSEESRSLQESLIDLIENLYEHFPAIQVTYALTMVLDKKFDEVCYPQKGTDKELKK